MLTYILESGILEHHLNVFACYECPGGCGSMYSIFIEAPDFQGLSTVKQHLLVNNVSKTT